MEISSRESISIRSYVESAINISVALYLKIKFEILRINISESADISISRGEYISIS